MRVNDKPTILVVDDEPHIVTFLRLYFEQSYHVYEANSGIQALLLAKQIKPDLVIMDTTLPKYDGFHVCGRMKQTPSLKDIPVLLMTLRMSAKDKLDFLRSGAEDFIAKPFDVHILERRMKRLLAKAQKPKLFEVFNTAEVHV